MSLAGEDLYSLVNEGVASHFDWKSPDELLLWGLNGEEYNNFVYKDKTSQIEVFAPDIFTASDDR